MAAYSIADSILAEDSALRGLWTFDDVYTDFSGNGNSLTGSGSPTFATAKFNNGLDLELSSSQFAYVADSASLSITGSMTMLGWIKVESAPAEGLVGMICSKANSTGNQRSWNFSLTVQGGVKQVQGLVTSTGVYDGASDVYVNWNFSTATLYHVAMVYNSTTPSIQFFIDGSALASPTGVAASSIYDSTARTVFGAKNTEGTADSYFDGIIDDFAIFNRALTSTEISQVYNGTIARRGAAGSPIFFGNTAIA